MAAGTLLQLDRAEDLAHDMPRWRRHENDQILHQLGHRGEDEDEGSELRLGNEKGGKSCACARARVCNQILLTAVTIAR